MRREGGNPLPEVVRFFMVDKNNVDVSSARGMSFAAKIKGFRLVQQAADHEKLMYWGQAACLGESDAHLSA